MEALAKLGDGDSHDKCINGRINSIKCTEMKKFDLKIMKNALTITLRQLDAVDFKQKHV